MSLVITFVLVLSGLHSLLGILSVCFGITSSIATEVRLDDHVSPIWSGAVFIITGILGFVCAKMKTSYPIIWFTASNVGALVLAVVSIQLLCRGKSSRQDDDSTSLSDIIDLLTDAALGVAGCECFVCSVSCIVSCRLAKTNRKELQKQIDNNLQVQDGAESSQGNGSNYNEGFFVGDPGVRISDGPDAELFTSLRSVHNDPGDYLVSCNLSSERICCENHSSTAPDLLDSGQYDISTMSHLTDSVTNSQYPDVNFDVGISDKQEEQRPDPVGVYTISSSVGLQDQGTSADLAIEAQTAETEPRNETYTAGEKPRLKRIINLIEDERGTFTANNGT